MRRLYITAAVAGAGLVAALFFIGNFRAKEEQEIARTLFAQATSMRGDGDLEQALAVMRRASSAATDDRYDKYIWELESHLRQEIMSLLGQKTPESIRSAREIIERNFGASATEDSLATIVDSAVEQETQVLRGRVEYLVQLGTADGIREARGTLRILGDWGAPDSIVASAKEMIDLGVHRVPGTCVRHWISGMDLVKAVAVDEQGTVFCIANNVIQSVNPVGITIQVGGTPTDLALRDGKVWVSYTRFQFRIRNKQPATGVRTYSLDGKELETYSGDFDGIQAIAFDTYDNLWVLDANAGVVGYYDENTHPSKWVPKAELHGASSIAVSSRGVVFVISRGCVYQFASDGELLNRFGEGVMKKPSGVAVDRLNHVYVSDLGEGLTSQLLKFSASGELLTSWTGCGEDGSLSFTSLMDVSISNDQEIFVADYRRGMIAEFEPYHE